ncbi:replication-relaxation family protein (plasmid) [Bacillus subtilis]|nr:replication-relaxation family protein [Bacillus subtilis]WOF32856.1 replication-relaxation family protein [Bacillus subtilis]
MGRAKGSWYEREEVKRITMDWVKTNCKFTSREVELLQLIHDRKLVRRDHLEIISPSYRLIKDSNVRRASICRAIKKMYKKMCLDKTHEAQEIGKGNTPSIVALDKGGSIYLNVPHKRRISHKKSIVNGKEYISRSLPANFRHINGVNQLEVDTILLSEKIEAEILEWTHEKPQEFHYGQEKVVVIPDVGMKLKFNTEHSKPLYAFIEYDTGSENMRYKSSFPTILEKVVKYRKLKSSKVWEKDYDYFPIVLLVTEDDKRITYFNDKCRENGLRGFGVYHENYSSFIKHLGNLL